MTCMTYYSHSEQHRCRGCRSGSNSIRCGRILKKDDGAEVYEERRSSEPDLDEKDEKGGADVVTSHCTEKLEDVREETVTR